MKYYLLVKNLHWTYNKLHCKWEPYQFSGERDPSLQTKKAYYFIYIKIYCLIVDLEFLTEYQTENILVFVNTIFGGLTLYWLIVIFLEIENDINTYLCSTDLSKATVQIRRNSP